MLKTDYSLNHMSEDVRRKKIDFLFFENPTNQKMDTYEIKNDMDLYDALTCYFDSYDPDYVPLVVRLLEEDFDRQSVRELFDLQSKRSEDLFKQRKEIDYFRHIFMLGTLAIFLGVSANENDLFLLPLINSAGTDTFNNTFDGFFNTTLPNIFKLYDLESIPRDESKDIFDFKDSIRTNFAFVAIYAATRRRDVKGINKVFEHFDFLIIEPAFPSNMKGSIRELGLGLLRSRYELGRGKLFFSKEIVEEHFEDLMKESQVVDYRFFLPYYKWDEDDEDEIFNEDYDTLELLNTDPEFETLIDHEYIDKYIRVKMHKYLPNIIIRCMSTKRLVGLYICLAKNIRIEFACRPRSMKIKFLRWFLNLRPRNLNTIRWLN
jgi:hypothetical protein